jgi:uncharacterized protein (TIGR03435 family)
MNIDKKKVEELLTRNLPLASPEEVEADCDQVWQRLKSRVPKSLQQEIRATIKPRQDRWGWSAAVFSAAAALLLMIFVGTAIVWLQHSPVAVVENVDSGLYRVSEGQQPESVSVRDRLEVGDTVRTADGQSAVFTLADGSSIEVRSGSELSLERADDGLRIHLAHGGVLVEAAKQRQGHLYVQTKDVTVQVVGTVFLVSAEEAGSRVAVIQGEVDIKRGAARQQLLPGEQVATNPVMPLSPVREEIAWSRNAQMHLALLQQSAFVPTTTGLQNSNEPRVRFEEASIRPSTPVVQGGARGGKGPGGCSGGSGPQLDPTRFAVSGNYLYTLMTMAYFGSNFYECLTVTNLGLLSGGPAWVQSDQWDVQAVIPQGAFTSTPSLRDPKFQNMLRRLLEDRFKLVVRRETKETPVYVMTLEDPAKFAGWKDATVWLTQKPRPEFWPDRLEDRQGLVAQEGGAVYGANATMTDLAPLLSRLTGRPVLDRTGFTRKFNFFLEYTIEFSSPEAAARFAATGRIGPGDMVSPLSGPRTSSEIRSLISELEKQAGIELKAGREPVEVLRIEHAERPGEN